MLLWIIKYIFFCVFHIQFDFLLSCPTFNQTQIFLKLQLLFTNVTIVDWDIWRNLRVNIMWSVSLQANVYLKTNLAFCAILPLLYVSMLFLVLALYIRFNHRDWLHKLRYGGLYLVGFVTYCWRAVKLSKIFWCLKSLKSQAII